MAHFCVPIWQWNHCVCFTVGLKCSLCLQIKKTAYAQSSQIRQIRKKMVEIMTREASSCDLKELVGKFIPEAIGAQRWPQALCLMFSNIRKQVVYAA